MSIQALNDLFPNIWQTTQSELFNLIYQEFENKTTIPFIVGLRANYQRCSLLNSTGCSILGQCGHFVSIWSLVEQLAQYLQNQLSNAPGMFRQILFECLSTKHIDCPVCGQLSHFSLYSRALPKAHEALSGDAAKLYQGM